MSICHVHESQQNACTHTHTGKEVPLLINTETNLVCLVYMIVEHFSFHYFLCSLAVIFQKYKVSFNHNIMHTFFGVLHLKMGDTKLEKEPAKYFCNTAQKAVAAV